MDSVYYDATTGINAVFEHARGVRSSGQSSYELPEPFQPDSSNFFSETVFDEMLPTRVFGTRQYLKLN